MLTHPPSAAPLVIRLTWPRAITIALGLIGGTVSTAAWVRAEVKDHIADHEKSPHAGVVTLERHKTDHELVLKEVRENRALLIRILESSNED